MLKKSKMVGGPKGNLSGWTSAWVKSGHIPLPRDVCFTPQKLSVARRRFSSLEATPGYTLYSAYVPSQTLPSIVASQGAPDRTHERRFSVNARPSLTTPVGLQTCDTKERPPSDRSCTRGRCASRVSNLRV